MDKAEYSASVVIPSSGRPAVLEATLEALCNLDAPRGSFEVIVVDDGAVPPLQDRLRPYRERLVLRSLRLEGRGPGAARNAAAGMAFSQLLIFLDDDCVPVPHWLRAYLDAGAEFPDCALAGPILNALPGNLCSEAFHLIFGYLYSRHVAGKPEGAGTHAPFIISANFAVPAELFRSRGGFDEQFRVAAEDRMFSENWLRSGRKFRAVGDARVYHNRPLTARAFVKQQFVYGRGSMVFRRAVRQRGWPDPTAESASFYRDLLLVALRDPDPLRRPVIFLLLALSQIATAAGYFTEYASGERA